MWLKTKEERKCFEKICMEVYDKFISLPLGTQNYAASDDDSVSSYAIQLLRIGCLYMEFADAIKEGDRQRVLRCWQYFILIFRASTSSTMLASLSISSISIFLHYPLGCLISSSGEDSSMCMVYLAEMSHYICICKDAMRNLGLK